MHFIIPTKAMSDSLYHHSNAIAAENNLQGVTMDLSISIIDAMVEEVVFSRLTWVTDVNIPSFQTMLEMIPWYVNTESGDYFSAKYYWDIIYPIFERIEYIANKHLSSIESDAAWRVWHITDMAGDKLLERGQDFRIVEYERLVMNGRCDV